MSLISEKATVCFICSALVFFSAHSEPEVWLEFMGGNVRKDGLALDLRAIKDAGFSGVHFFHVERGGVWPGCPEQIPCLSTKWNNVVGFLGAECERLGLSLTVQNCPGWSQSGGPWVPLSACMREVTYSRRDVSTGGRLVLPEIPRCYQDKDSDWKDIAVLAFPTPEGDTGDALKPISVEVKGDERIYRFAAPVIVRTMTLPGLHDWNSAYGYHPPWRRVTLEAMTPEGWKIAARTPLPTTSWRDYVRTFTVACNELESDTWHYKLEHDYPIKKFGEPKLYSGARQTDWESKSGLVLRSLLREPPPRQSKDAWLSKEKVIDVTGKPDWVVPNGRWTILRVANVNAKRVNAPAPKEATGWECDKLDPIGIETHFKGYVGKLLEGPLNKRMHGMLVDSWECFGQTWTPKMEDYFCAANKYELRKFLPALFGWVVNDHETTERFLTDWRRTLGNLITKNYYGRMAELAHASGLDCYYETAFGDIIHGDLLEYWKYADAPMCEFWYPHVSHEEGGIGTYVYKSTRPCVSAAHVYGKSRVVAEAFTENGIRWDEDFQKLQDVANRFLARGITHLAFQSYTHSPDPQGLPPGGCMGGFNGTPFTRLQTWWRFMPEFTGWLTRCEKLLEEGTPSLDILWYLGDAVDHKPDENYPIPEGFRADYLNHDALVNRLRVVDGLFTIPEGARWRVLWVPDDYRMLPDTRKRLSELAAAGGTVVFGGKGELGKALSVITKDVTTEPALGDAPSEDFMWIHRKVGEIERYFVAAGTNGYRGRVTFRAQGKATVYDPVTQERRAWRNGNDLAIPVSRSVFVEFNRNESIAFLAKEKDFGETVSFAPWSLTFPDGECIPVVKSLDWSSISELSREKQAFAGTATFKTSFECPDGVNSAVLELGGVASIAEVYLNGIKAGVLWCRPLSIDLSHLLKQGKNVLRIDVTNTWRNRVIYDLGQPKEGRQTWIIQQPGLSPTANDPFVPAGIQGPVSVWLHRK